MEQPTTTQPNELYLKKIDDERIDTQQEFSLHQIKRFAEYCVLDALMNVNCLSFDELVEIDKKRWRMAKEDGLNLNPDYE